nr:hypothetical protein [uncultured bacterium]
MDDLEKLLNERLEDKEFKKEWEEFQPELQLMKKVIGKKIKENISQKGVPSGKRGITTLRIFLTIDAPFIFNVFRPFFIQKFSQVI